MKKNIQILIGATVFTLSFVGNYYLPSLFWIIPLILGMSFGYGAYTNSWFGYNKNDSGWFGGGSGGDGGGGDGGGC